MTLQISFNYTIKNQCYLLHALLNDVEGKVFMVDYTWTFLKHLRDHFWMELSNFVYCWVDYLTLLLTAFIPKMMATKFLLRFHKIETFSNNFNLQLSIYSKQYKFWIILIICNEKIIEILIQKYIIYIIKSMFKAIKDLTNIKWNFHLNNGGRRYIMFINKRKAWDYIVTTQ